MKYKKVEQCNHIKYMTTCSNILDWVSQPYIQEITTSNSTSEWLFWLFSVHFLSLFRQTSG